MAFNLNGGKSAHTSPMVEINTTPLVDVMLVLLVIFLITAPLFHQAVPIDLPKVDSTPTEQAPNTLQVAIDAKGAVTVDGTPVSMQSLPLQLRVVKGETSSTEMHLRADRATRYERVAEVMASAQSVGITKIAFVTEKSNSTP